MSDAIYESFLSAQGLEAARLEAQSDILSFEPLGRPPHARYVARFDARSVLIGNQGPRVTPVPCVVGIWFPGDYVYRVNPSRVLTWLGPDEIFHPNVRAPFICLGTLQPGTPLVELCFRVFSVISYQNYGLTSPLNPAAAAWARRNLTRFPIDPRPLKRRIGPWVTRVFERGGAA